MSTARHNWIPRHPDDGRPLPADTPPIDLSRLMGEDMEKLRAEFERIYRRRPGEGDPVWLPFQLLMSKDDVDDVTDDVKKSIDEAVTDDSPSKDDEEQSG